MIMNLLCSIIMVKYFHNDRYSALACRTLFQELCKAVSTKVTSPIPLDGRNFVGLAKFHYKN